MKRKLICLLLGLCMLLSMAACGNSDDSAASAEASASASAAESGEEASAEESSAEEAASAEDSEVEEPTADDLFAEMIAGADSICMELRCYDHRGTPIRNGSVTLTADGKDTVYDTDFSGFALIDGLTADTEYTVTVTDGEEEEPATYGTVTMKIVDADEYAGTMTDDGAIEISVADGTGSAVYVAITATSNDDESSFEVSDAEAWAPSEE